MVLNMVPFSVCPLCVNKDISKWAFGAKMTSYRRRNTTSFYVMCPLGSHFSPCQLSVLIKTYYSVLYLISISLYIKCFIIKTN